MDTDNNISNQNITNEELHVIKLGNELIEVQRNKLEFFRAILNKCVELLGGKTPENVDDLFYINVPKEIEYLIKKTRS